MPAQKTATEAAEHIALPCSGDSDFGGCERCMQLCMNCRREVKSSMTRVAGRKLRKMKALPSCSVDNCVAFLLTVDDLMLRFHLSSMAWWRFSADDEKKCAEPLRRVMVACPPFPPDFGRKYMHMAIRTLSRLSQEQLSVWFGCDNVYTAAAMFSGDRPELTGPHCTKCGLYKLGCTAYGTLMAESCPFWDDKFVQGVASAVMKSGTWKDPCKGVEDAEAE